MILDALSVLLLVLGLFFFVSGLLGLWRFPDTFARLHALTKADNLGLGLVMTGLLFQVPDVLWAIKFVLVWLLALVASAVNAHLIAVSLHRQQEGHDESA
ncbi:MAG: monovalent cation/H(+) antiporter subunit G [Candidatus Thiothrix putei]|uniref:Monovalent cation/H(+) antiporter subunit G n=1 Tax=Candidatus Thiothrix putei TaxID=3080811 RepID=A0AA95KI73_9GAMM|nr:MAG: monovalent cation/H(+) antiporter subunit G [Candidatus Thiothrix putei]